MWQHKHHSYKNSFSDKYNAVKLLYYEYFEDIRSAIQREKQLKHWKREWKWDLIKKTNSELRDLYDELSG